MQIIHLVVLVSIFSLLTSVSAQADPPAPAGQNAPPAVADAANVETSPAEQEKEELNTPPPYEYLVTSRPDPFKPFIAPKSVNPNEIVSDDDAELTGMRLFEPAQLSLVGVMETSRGRIAMVEDVTKKGYKIIEGQLIGRRGKVTEIQKDQVIVTETARTRGGEEIKTVVSMKLKRDGEGK